MKRSSASKLGARTASTRAAPTAAVPAKPDAHELGEALALAGALRHISAQAEPTPPALIGSDAAGIAVQQQVIHLVASGYRITEVARRAGVARRTIYNWIERDLDFNRRLAEEICERRDSLRQAASATWHVAADVLRDILASGTTAEKLAAASLALRYAGAVLGGGEPPAEPRSSIAATIAPADRPATEVAGRRPFAPAGWGDRARPPRAVARARTGPPSSAFLRA
jgi:transposase-like protein